MKTLAENLFTRALELPESERDAFLAEACGGDAELHLEVRRLLVEAARADSFFGDADRVTLGNEDFKESYAEKEGDVIGPYKLRQQIGEGGFGTVWMAEQGVPISRMVALKVIKAGMDTKQVLARFEAERQALAMMDHPHIAKVLDAGATATGRPWFAMELVKGIPITDYCDQAGLGTRERLALFRDVCSAIQHAHQKGIIHRDIKPSNVMVTLHGDMAVVKVIDFGIAKATQGKLTDKTLFTRYEQFIGTPVYMSPEQAATSGLDIDTRSDIYALGILLYELLVGKPPFDSKSLLSAGYEEMRRIIREVEPVKPSSRVGTMAAEERTLFAKARHNEPGKVGRLIEPDLDWIVMKAIEKDRARRYETANGLALDIQRFLADEAVSARPPTAGYQMQKFIRRHRPQVVAAALGLLLMLAGMGGTTFGLIRANSSARAERSAKQDAEARRAEAEAQQIRAEANEKLAAAAERKATEQATTAELLANYVNAKYMLSQGRVGPAYEAIGAAMRVQPHWEYGHLLSEVVARARKDWRPVARFAEGTDPLPATAFVGPSDQILAIVSGTRLRLFDVPSSRVAGETDLEMTAVSAFKIGAGAVGVSNARSVRIFSLDDLSNNRSLALKGEVRLAVADPGGKVVAVLATNGDATIFDVATMRPLAEHHFDLATAAVGSPAVPSLSFSPSGKLLLFSPGLWTKASLLWDWTADKSIEHAFGSISSTRFLDEDTVMGVNRSMAATDELGFNLTNLQNLRDPPIRVGFRSTAGNNPFCWHERDGDGRERILAASTSADSIDIFTLAPQAYLSSTRFTTLLPTSPLEPRFLAFSPDSGLMALSGEQGVTVFQSAGFKSIGVAGPPSTPMRFWSLAAANDGIYTADTRSDGRFEPHGERLKSLHLIRRSFADDAVSKIACQWPKAGGTNGALPWGIAVTPDGKTIAVLWQENSSGGNIAAEYHRKAILIYHMDSTPDNEGQLAPKRTIWLEKYQGLNGRSNRGLCLSPDGRTVAFFAGNGDATIYRVEDGRVVADVHTGPTICRSPDGSLIAGGSFLESMPVRVWQMGGKTPIFTTPVSGEIATAAITPDNQKLYVKWNSDILECFDIASGTSVSKVNTKIYPLAISPAGDRFVGFLPANNMRNNVNGSCVLGDLANGQTVLVINESAHVLNRAFFSPTGNVVAFMNSRDSAGMSRSLTTDEAARQLEQLTPFDGSTASSNALPMEE